MPLMRRFFLKVCSMVWSFVFSGLEKYELLAKLAGNEDPFFLRAVTRGKVWTANIWVSMIKTFSIFREPRKTPPLLTLWTTTGNIERLRVQIMHHLQLRMVGCVCAEEDTNIKWTWLSEVLSPVFLEDFEPYTLSLDHLRVPPRGASVDSGWSWSPTLPQTSMAETLLLSQPHNFNILFVLRYALPL